MIIIDIDASNRIRRAKVTFSYAADNNDELTLQPGQVFNIFDAGLTLSGQLGFSQLCFCLLILCIC